MQKLFCNYRTSEKISILKPNWTAVVKKQDLGCYSDESIIIKIKKSTPFKFKVTLPTS